MHIIYIYTVIQCTLYNIKYNAYNIYLYAYAMYLRTRCSDQRLLGKQKDIDSYTQILSGTYH